MVLVSGQRKSRSSRYPLFYFIKTFLESFCKTALNLFTLPQFVFLISNIIIFFCNISAIKTWEEKKSIRTADRTVLNRLHSLPTTTTEEATEPTVKHLETKWLLVPSVCT